METRIYNRIITWRCSRNTRGVKHEIIRALSNLATIVCHRHMAGLSTYSFPRRPTLSPYRAWWVKCCTRFNTLVTLILCPLLIANINPPPSPPRDKPPIIVMLTICSVLHPKQNASCRGSTRRVLFLHFKRAGVSPKTFYTYLYTVCNNITRISAATPGGW